MRTPGWKITLLETNSKGTENRPSEKETSRYSKHPFSGAMLLGYRVTAVFHKVMEVDAAVNFQRWLHAAS